MRFSSLPVQGALLSELQAHRALDNGDREPELWQHQLQGQVNQMLVMILLGAISET